MWRYSHARPFIREIGRDNSKATSGDSIYNYELIKSTVAHASVGMARSKRIHDLIQRLK
jgi:hypothetical protein